MATWDRFDICEAYSILECDYNVGGWLRERPSNQRRRESCGVQLHRIQFRPSMGSCFEEMTENGQEIYLSAVMRLALPVDEEQHARLVEMFGEGYRDIDWRS
jgi:hypothetical protein